MTLVIPDWLSYLVYAFGILITLILAGLILLFAFIGWLFVKEFSK